MRLSWAQLGHKPVGRLVDHVVRRASSDREILSPMGFAVSLLYAPPS